MNVRLPAKCIPLSGRAALLTCALLSAVALLGAAPGSASAETTAEQLGKMSVTEPFNGSTESVANFGSKWSTLGWAGGHSPKGADATNGWHPVDAYPTLNGAYYSTSIADKGAGLAVAATMATSPGLGNNYFSLWLDMPTPGGTKAGYELRFTYTSTNTYTVKLSKWVGGTETELASKTGYSFQVGSSLALVDGGGTVSVWTNTGSGFGQLLSATDSTFGSGNAGVAGAGANTRLTNFKAASFAVPPDTTITGGSNGRVTPDVSFTFSASGESTSIECALDAGAYSACTSPKSYEGLAEGSHTFKVRAVGPGGADPTPAERSVTVLETASAVSSVSVLDDFGRSENPIANGKWTKTSWASKIGASWTGSWHGFGGWGGTVSGAYWNGTTFSDASAGLLVSATLGSGPTANGEYVSLWLDMPSPGSARSGYEARFTGTNGSPSAYKVELSKWVSGTRTVLGTKEGFSLPKDTTFALTETGGRLGIWTGTTSFSRVLSAYDATYSSGYAGIETNGGEGTAYNFRAGNVSLAPPNTTIATGSSSGVVVPNVGFSFTATEQSVTFECSLDQGTYSACTSAKSYQGLGEGSHTFHVRAVGAGGTDQSPAERGVQVVNATTATSKVPIRDDFGRSEYLLENKNWTKTSWAEEVGSSWSEGWHGFGADSGLAGAYWNPSTFSDTAGADLVSAVVGTGSTPSGQYVGLWLNMPSPSSARSGYEARFTGTGTPNIYEVTLSKWAAGTRTVLASTSGFSLPVGTTIAFSDTGGNLTLWTGTSTIAQVLSANDSTYTNGYAGIEVNGGAGTYYNFRAGLIDIESPNTTITSGPEEEETVLPSEASFSFESSDSEAHFECSMDTEPYAACASPKSYPSIAGGEHTFHVRAADPVGNQDATPATRTFQVTRPPIVTTEAPTGIKAKEATLKGRVNPNGQATTYRFEYGTTTSYGSVAPATPEGIGAGFEAVAVSRQIGGLEAGATYHFRVMATNSSGTSYGQDLTFTTPAAPTAATEAATGVAAEEATLHAGINPRRASTSYQFEYGTSTSYGSKAPIPAKVAGSGNEAVEITEIIKGLVEDTTYHYRVVAENEVGVTYGEDKTFETPPLPEAITETAVSVEANEAVVAGTVDPNGSDTTYRFEYGPAGEYEETGQYGEAAPAAVEAGDGEEADETWEAFGGLAPETTYHYRMVAESPTGKDFGPDRTFTTTAAVMSPQEEVEERAAEEAVTSSYQGSLPTNFFGMMWTGNIYQMAEGQIENAVKKSGARMLRLEMAPTGDQNAYEQIIDQAARRGRTVVPYIGSGSWPTDEAGQNTFSNYAKDVAVKYGPGGTFWSGKSYAKPMSAMELWNEPNLGRWYPDQKVNKNDAEAFGTFFSKMSAKAKEGGITNVILSGLFGFTSNVCSNNGTLCNMSINDFLQDMGHTSSYDSVGIHPYVFKVGDNLHKPQNHDDVIKAKDRIAAILKTAHEKLVGMNEGNKPLWVTEAGFPVEYSGETSDAPGVSESIQKELIESTLFMMQNRHDDFNIARIFYYNLQDRNANPEWASHTGLRKLHGGRRPSWSAFAKQAGGDPDWPRNPTKKSHSVQKRPNMAMFSQVYDPDGQLANVKVEVGKGGESNSYERSQTKSFGAEEEEEAEAEANVGVSEEVSGLEPNQTYHYKVTTTSENETSESETGTFQTPPQTEVGISVKEALNGEPGWVTVGGYVHEGAPSGEVGAPVPNVWLNVNFWKLENGSWVYKSTVEPHPVTNSEGYYQVENRSVSKGTWKVRAVLPAQNGWNEAETPSFHEFTIKNGYRLIAEHSGKCLDVEQESTESGMKLHQWECLNPATQMNQIFTLVPVGNHYFEVVARHSNKCVDVRGGSTEVGAQIQQWDCNHTAAQRWRITPAFENPESAEYVNLAAEVSGQCMDVSEGSTANGALVHQWPCLGSGQANQIWRLQSVEAGDIPTHTYVTPGETLYGQPGYQSVSGTVDLGAYSVSGKYVNVNFEKENSSGGWDYVDTIEPHPTLNGESRYSYEYWGLGSGNWRVRTVFPGEGALAKSESEYHYLHVGTGYRLMNRYSRKCLTVWEDSGENGAPIVQWDCSPGPTPGDGQVLTLVPLGGGYFNLRVNRSVSISRCVDVTNVSQEPHAQLQLWDCLGAGQANQLWEKIPISGQNPWMAFRVKHSGQCLDNTGPSEANGNRLQQYTCNWSGAQQWEIQPIG